jgi:RNA polymerase sigma factor (TIGR02999 family)
MPDEGNITQLLCQWRQGSREAENELFTLVLPNLRRIARYLMNRERQGHSLEATELVDQVYFRLVAARDRDWQNRAHFFAIAARAMRRQLIDHARSRPGARFVTIEGEDLPVAAEQMDTAIAIDQLLDRMAETKPDWCTVIEVKFFLGLTDEEAAESLGMGLRTLQRIWRDARRWLFERMEAGNARRTTG